MFTLHDKNAVPTQKHLGSKRTSVGQGVVSKKLKTVQWLVLWVERNKDDVNKSTLLRKWVFKFDTTHFHGRVRRSDVHGGISARRGDVETHLCGREMLCGTHQIYDNTEIRTPSGSFVLECRYSMNLMSELTKSIIGPTRQQCYSGAQETTSVRCKQSCGNTGKLIDGSMETRHRCRKPCRHWNPLNVHRRPQGVCMVKRAGIAKRVQRKLVKAMESRERALTRASYQYCSNRNWTRTTIWLQTIQYL